VQFKEILLWALHKRRPWRVLGTSMEPEFCEGDLVLIDPKAPLTVGAAVVARHPYKNLDVIKYVASIDADDHIALHSPAGEDSRQFGRAPVHAVKGVVTMKWKRNRSL